MAKAAFLGTGLLGSGMVEAMLRHGDAVVVWNRTAAKARALESLGATVAVAPEQAVEGVDRVHLALPDDAVVDEMIDRIGPHLPRTAVVIDHSTTAPVQTKARLTRAAAAGLQIVHAPVFMSPEMCRECTGLMLASGPQRVFERVRPVLERMTGEVWYLGEREDLAAAYKIFGNSMVFVLMAGLADVMTMARSVGVPETDAAALFSKFKLGGFVTTRAQKMAEHDYTATFELTMARKDIRLMIEAAADQPLVVLPTIAARMDQAIREGHGQKSLAVIAAPQTSRRSG